MSNILITGGAGFIGSNLAKELTKDNHVVVYDNFSLGCLDNLKDVKCKTVIGNITDYNKLKEVIKENKIEQIYHLAANSASPMFKQPYWATKTNILGTMVIFELAKEFKIKRVVYASTSTVYAGLQPPFFEESNITPKNYYAMTKLCNEQMAWIYSKEHNLETVGARFFSVYGPNELNKKEFANVLTQFLINMNNDKQPVIYGDGTQTRDFIHVSDICAGLKLMMEKEGISGEIFNLGTGIQTSLLELIEEINFLLEKSLKPIFTKNQIEGYVKFHEASRTKAETILGFKPKILLKDGLKLMKEAYVKDIAI